ncbi:GGDEF domain-containing protein [Clostridium bowmanii]|uniref:GGDEF domain-containing protein n=1 Tax=Clostridium bowmanii TaxID=132925 RepID=UPI001C0C22C6|nr:GGDEF domain-containing protein [Clostridium bowmanii]MBU3191886.1 GGDEF domain-containing protein [Clostridium bowmanii]MCA1076122.1 GGDEF domain-containing protein [Clostridium bowmanii]
MDYLANHDNLTGLFNKTYFINFLDIFIEKAKVNKKTCSILFIDLDGFKAVNDTYGHDVGDKLLKSISKILTDNIREVDLASRFGGDEFIIFLYNISKDDVTKISKRIVRLLSETIRINQCNCNIGASIGISMFPEHGDNSQILINRSDLGMYTVKKRGKNDYCFYEEEC